MHNLNFDVIHDDVKSSDLITVLFIAAKLLDSQHSNHFISSQDPIVFIHQVADSFGLPVDFISRKQSHKLELSTSSSEINLALLIAHLNAFLVEEHQVISLYATRTMIDALEKRAFLSDQATSEHKIEHIGCVYDHTAVAAIYALAKGYAVDFYFESELLQNLFAWLVPVFSGRLSYKKFEDISNLPKYDAIVITFPISNRNHEDAEIYELLRLKSNFIVALHALKFYLRGGSHERARQRLFFNDLPKLPSTTFIKALIALPALGHPSLPTAQLMVVDYGQDIKKIKMLDLAEVPRRNTEHLAKINLWDSLLNTEAENVRYVDCCEISKNNFNLAVSAYIMDAGLQSWIEGMKTSEAYLLSDLVDFDRILAFRSWEEGEDAKVFYELAISDIDEFGQITSPNRVRYVSYKDVPLIQKQCLKPGDILISVKGSLGKIVFMPENIPNNWFVSPSFVVCRIKERESKKGLNAQYLYKYLMTEMVQAYLKHLNTGGSVPMIRLEDIKKVPVEFGNQFLYELARNQCVEKHELVNKIAEIKKMLVNLDADFARQLEQQTGRKYH